MPHNIGARDYWRFAWLRYPGRYLLEMKPPVREIGVLKKFPDYQVQFVRAVAGGAQPEVYFPLEDAPGISKEFADLKEPNDVLGFVNRFGLLGLQNLPGLVQSYHKEIDRRGERTSEWLDHALELRRLYELWDLIQAGDERGLRHIIRWSDRDVRAWFPDVQPVIAGVARNGRWLPRWKRGDVYGPAKLFIADQYNTVMAQMASPLLRLDAKGALRPYNSPSCLLAALWFEFGEVVSGARKQLQCESCGKWMDVTDNRSNKRKHDNCVLREKMARYRHKIAAGAVDPNA